MAYNLIYCDYTTDCCCGIPCIILRPVLVMKLIYMYVFVHFANVKYRKLHTMQYIRFHTNPTFQRLYRLSGLYVSTFITIACNYRPTYWLFLTLLYSLSCGTAYISALASHFYGIQYTVRLRAASLYLFLLQITPPPLLPLFLPLSLSASLSLSGMCRYTINTDYKCNSVSVIANYKFKIIPF